MLVLLGVASVIVVVENLEAVAVIASANADVRATGGCVFGVATYCHMCCSCYLPTATGVEVVVVEDVTFCSFCWQCDQEVILFVQYLAIHNGDKLPNSIIKLPKSVHNFAQCLINS